MEEAIKFLQQWTKIQYRINANDKKPRNFGTSQLLHQSEIHFIDAIETGEGLNASQLSEKLGVTNGAVTQTADKLLKKHLIKKYRIPGNKKEIYLKLTPEGEIAFKNHRLFHKKTSDKIIDYLDSLSAEQLDALFGLLDIIERNLPDLTKEAGE